MKNTGLTVVATLLMASSMAGELDSPLGNWKTISDKNGKVESVIQIYQDGGELKGRIVNVFNPPNPNCTKCRGALKDQPLIGLNIMSGLKQDGNIWNGGKIIDPADGSEYNVKLELADEGQKLKVRGFIGFSLFGRTQTWLRDSK
ncbi:DUF2147 domain-containing protein [Chitinimonas sp.]|uniref:DUF2147 domain-containing protein n=1 Tax=Chitinimonas sp. TaxID=1934313 RepID=UPI0035B1E1BA